MSVNLMMCGLQFQERWYSSSIWNCEHQCDVPEPARLCGGVSQSEFRPSVLSRTSGIQGDICDCFVLRRLLLSGIHVQRR